MARYTGPKHKLTRREGINLLEKTSASLQRRLNIRPGVHGKKMRRRPSEFGQQLREKQKAKAVYGVLERQFAKMVETVQKQKGDTGSLLISSLETRLDNVVYRLGFAKNRFMARQFVSHGHVFVDGKKVTIPSFQVKPGVAIALSEKIQKNPDVQKLTEEEPIILSYLEKKKKSGKLIRVPTREDVQVPFDIQLIVEYYSR